MRSAFRSVVAVVAGFVAASVVMMIFEMVNGRFLYPGLAKAAEGVKDREAIRALLASAPAGAFFAVIAGWIVGGAAGGWVTARLAGKAKIAHGAVLAALLTLAGVANNLMLPPPLWFWIVSLAVLAPATLFGAHLAAVHPSR